MKLLGKVVHWYLTGRPELYDNTQNRPIPIGPLLVRAVRKLCPEYGDVVSHMAICDAAVSSGTVPQMASLRHGRWYVYGASANGLGLANDFWAYVCNREYDGVAEIIEAARLYWIALDPRDRMLALSEPPRKR